MQYRQNARMLSILMIKRILANFLELDTQKMCEVSRKTANFRERLMLRLGNVVDLNLRRQSTMKRETLNSQLLAHIHFVFFITYTHTKK